MVKSKHHHPNLLQNRIIQYGAIGLLAVMLLSVPLQMILTILLGAPGGLFFIAGLVTFGLTPPVLMVTVLSPTIIIQHDGIWIEPLIWKRRFILWEQIDALKVYPLLPPESGEVQRRAFVGRRNYKPAEGIMLVTKHLPFQYRIGAFFAGEAGSAIIALTNRSHTDYDHMKKNLCQYLGEIQPHA